MWVTAALPGHGGLGRAARVMLALQRTAGNRAVQLMVPVQRCGSTLADRCGCQVEGQGGDGEAIVQRQVAVQRQDHTVGDMCTAKTDEPNASRAPAPEESVCKEPLHVLTYQGRQYAIPESQWPAFRTRLKKTFRTECSTRSTPGWAAPAATTTR